MSKFFISLVIVCLLHEITGGREKTKSKPKYKPKIKTQEHGKLPKKVKVDAKLASVSNRDNTKTLKPRLLSAQRIVNGTRAHKPSFPFLVSIQAYNRTGNTWIHGCGGSIVNDRHILTACHCVALIVGNNLIYANFKRMRIVAGTDSLVQLSPMAQIRNVSRSIAHPTCSNFPDRDNGWFGNDVSLLVLANPLQFNEQVQPMKLYSQDMNQAVNKLKEMVSSGQLCVVPGWGSTVEFKVQPPEFLMASHVNLIPDQSCREMYCARTKRHCKVDFNLVGQVCGVSNSSSDCQGDSGGPLVCNGKVFGTVSYGERCIPGWPSVFQGIRPILEVINKSRETQVDQQSNPASVPFRGGSRSYQISP